MSKINPSAIRVVDNRCRITIPQEFRELCNLEEGSIVKIEVVNSSITIRKVAVIDSMNQSEQENKDLITTAMNALQPNAQLKIAKGVLNNLERNYKND